jgi:DnaJ-class molecular chaperone
VDLFLIILGAAAAWTVRAYFWPFAPCRKCKGARTNRGSSRKRFGTCPRCGGTGTRQVLGSKAVHRAVRSLIAYRNNSKEK